MSAEEKKNPVEVMKKLNNRWRQEHKQTRLLSVSDLKLKQTEPDGSQTFLDAKGGVTITCRPRRYERSDSRNEYIPTRSPKQGLPATKNTENPAKRRRRAKKEEMVELLLDNFDEHQSEA